MSTRFAGRTAVVTGGAQGIGLAISERLAREGATVTILDVNEENLDRARADLASEELGVDTRVCDVADPGDVERTFEAIAADNGGVDILVNNAGITRDNLLFRMSDDDWLSVLQVNLTGAFNCARAAQRYMVPKGTGRIVNVSSRSALGNRGQANYSAAKAGIQGLTATLAIELGKFGITVNAVAPGYIATPMTAATAARVGTSPADHQAAAAARTPLGRVGQPEEVAAVVAFFAGADASYVSGQTLYINGGAR